MLSRLQELLLDVLLSDDPEQTLRRQVEQAADLSEEERACLQRINTDGLIMSALLIKKLRFERLTSADRELAEMFEQSPEQFVQLFNAYTSAVSPSAYFPEQEAGRYHQWREETDSPP